MHNFHLHEIIMCVLQYVNIWMSDKHGKISCVSYFYVRIDWQSAVVFLRVQYECKKNIILFSSEKKAFICIGII